MTTTSQDPRPEADGPDPGAQPDPDAGLRASHADRERVAAVLHAAVGRGLLTMEEVDGRLAVAYAARHLTELGPLVADLPPDDGAGYPPTAPGWAALWTMLLTQLRALVDPSGQRGRRAADRRLAAVAAVVAAVLVGVLGLVVGFDLA